MKVAFDLIDPMELDRLDADMTDEERRETRRLVAVVAAHARQLRAGADELAFIMENVQARMQEHNV